MDLRIIAAVVAILILIAIVLSAPREKFSAHRVNWRCLGSPPIPPVWRSL